MGLLGSIFSAGDSAKRQIRGLLDDPIGVLQQKIGHINDGARVANQMTEAAATEQDRSGPANVALRDYLSERLNPLAMTKSVGNQAASLIDDSYRGSHRAPMKGDSSAPLHDLTKIYPDDIYSNRAAQYYGHYGDARDIPAVSLMQQVRNQPNKVVTMYRAVPHEKTLAQQVAKIEKDLAAYQRRGKVPAGSVGSEYLKGSAWYENASNMRDRLAAKMTGQQSPQRLVINNGDWVTLSKDYAKEHGEGALSGNYKIISQKVPARKLFTDGNSIHEFGYDESGRITPQMLGLLGLGTAAGVGGYNYLQDANQGLLKP